MSDTSPEKILLEKSLMQSSWVVKDPDLNAIECIMRQFDLPEIVARLLVSRGIGFDDVESFIQPTLKNDFPNPFALQGMDICASDVAAAIQAGERFAIFGDFDVDGATSSAIAHRFLKVCGIDAPIYIPERLTEGYGPNEDAVRSLRDAGADVLLMLDCGSSAHQVLQVAEEIGLKIVVLDHHEVPDVIPPAWHLINPKRQDDDSDFDMLAAVGVTFLFCVAVNSKLRENDFFNKNNKQEPDLKAMLDLVALGTVCDIVPLLGPNRLFVRQGFRVQSRSPNPGLQALARVAGIAPPFTPYHAGYVLGPRVNAGSRVGKSSLGAEMFASDDIEAIQDIAWTLNDCNDKRKDMQSEMEAEALRLIEMQDDIEAQPILLVHKDNWHSGLTGLIAGRLKDKFAKPVCVISFEDGVGKASGRSLPGVHLGQLFIDAVESGLLQKGGGHAMAGGFTIAKDKLEAFKAFAVDHVLKQLDGHMPSVEEHIDTLMTVRGASQIQVIKTLHDSLGPFGASFSEPLILFQNVILHTVDIVGENHIRVLMSDKEGGPRMKAMAFRAVDTDMGEAFLKTGRKPFHLLGHLKINSWQGNESVELHIRDAAYAD